MKTNLLEPSIFRVEFPAEVLAERKEMIDQILTLMARNTSRSVREACRIHNAWLDRYSNDYIMLDLGESLWMLADAIKATTSEAVAAEERPFSASR